MCVCVCVCVLLHGMHHYHIIKVGEQCVYCAVRTEFLGIMWTAFFILHCCFTYVAYPIFYVCMKKNIKVAECLLQFSLDSSVLPIISAFITYTNTILSAVFKWI